MYVVTRNPHSTIPEALGKEGLLSHLGALPSEPIMARLVFVLLLTVRLVAQVVEESFFRDPGPLDFIRGEGLEQFILQSLTGDSLVGLDAQGRVVPRLALRWDIQPQGLRLLLRGDARFHSGKPLAFEDVQWTFQEIQRDPSASPTKRAILEGLTVSESKGWLNIRGSKSPHRILLELARIPITQKGHREVGSGPFLLDRQGTDWHLKAQIHFLKPSLPSLHFRLVGEDQALLQNLQKGWLTLGVPPSRPGLLPPSTHRQLIQPTHAQVVVWSKVGPLPLQALERWRGEAFPKDFFGDKAQPSRGLWPETLGFRPMAIQAPAPQSLKGQSFEMLFPGGDELVQKALLALRARAQKEGVLLEPRPVDPALLYDRLQKGDFQLACAVVLFDPHPWAVLEYLEAKGPMNFTAWHHARLQALLPGLQQLGNPAWEEVHKLWAQAPAALPLMDLQSVLWVDKRLQVTPSPMGLYLATPGAAGWRWGK